MKAIIIAGGLGTRLRPLTYNTPKPIVPVANRPFVVHQIELLRRHGIKEIILNLHYLSEAIKKILEEGKEWGVKIYYSVETTPLGTAGAVKNAEEYFDEEELLVFNGDILTDINVSQIIEYHKKKKARVTLTLTRVEDPTAYGLILIDDDRKVIRFIEKPSWEQISTYAGANTINAGIYILDPKIFKDVPRGVEYSFERQLFPSLLEQGEPIYGFISDRYWIDIGNPVQYRQAHEAILRNEVAIKIFGTRVDGKIWIGEGSKVDKTVKFTGPAIIGKGVEIGAGAKIKDYSVLGNGVSVGAESEIEHSIVWEGTKIGSHVSLSNCIVGFNCIIEDYVRIGEGMVLADNSVIRKGSKINA
ncbi:MAG: sugar phosphate nucleotidyltransferase [Candidatus Margulisiibacteriota bacterium]